jgi:hypothetical protein
MGGISSVIDRPDSTEEEIRFEYAGAAVLRRSASFIPSYTYGGAGTIFPTCARHPRRDRKIQPRTLGA